jgi:simple sugar transport system ATP-binding protein
MAWHGRSKDLPQRRPCPLPPKLRIDGRGFDEVGQPSMPTDVSPHAIARNVFIGREPLKWSLFGLGWMDRGKMDHESVQAIADVDLHLRSPEALVGELSGGQRQGVAIARAMHFKSKVLILDEPTNHLSVKETNKVIGFVRDLKKQNVTGVFISHNMQHVFQCYDRVVAMARGEIVFDRPVAESSIEEVHEFM